MSAVNGVILDSSQSMTCPAGYSLCRLLVEKNGNTVAIINLDVGDSVTAILYGIPLPTTTTTTSTTSTTTIITTTPTTTTTSTTIPGIPSNLKVWYLGGGDTLNFPEGVIGQVIFSMNNAKIKNIGSSRTDLFVCGQDFPGIVQFKLKYGTRMSGWKTLAECPDKTDVTPTYMWFYKGLQPQHSIQIYNPRILYTGPFTEGKLVITT